MKPDEYRAQAAQLRAEAEELEARARVLREKAAELDSYAEEDAQSPPSVDERFRRLFP
jgi:hypothetical protein